MDAFEQIVSDILWVEGFWVRTSVKVLLTKEEKELIGRRTTPRWELDIVAYSGRDHLLRVVECKSYIDSVGVQAKAFDGSDPEEAKHYKLFNDDKLRKVVFNRLCVQFYEKGYCRADPQVRLSLACGKIRNEIDRTKIRAHFEARNWDLWDEPWLQQRLRQMAGKKESYENQVSVVMAKILLRGKGE